MGISRTGRKAAAAAATPSAARPVETLEARVLFATFTWDGGGGDDNWTTPANWAGDDVPAGDGTSDLVFPAAALRRTNVNDFTPGAAFASITFTGGGYAISGNPINLGAGGVTDSSSGGGDVIDASNSFGLDAAIAGPVTIADADPAAPLFIGGTISGAGGSVNRTGGGVVVLDAANTYDGGTTLLGGDTFANNVAGSAFGAGPVTNAGGTLRGNGGFSGALANNAGLAPGTTSGVPGTLATGPVDFGAGASFGINVTGDAPGSGYDQLVVTGAVDLGAAAAPLNEAGSSFEPAGGELLFVIVNDGADPVTGAFAGLGQGDAFDINGFSYAISYAGDSAAGTFTGGNDVVLRAGPPNVAPVNAVPAAQATDEDAPLVFASATGNAITVADSANVALTVTLSVPAGSGTLALPPDATLTDDAASGNVVSIGGSVTDVNAALQGLTFTPAADSPADVTLTVTSSDGSLSDTDTVAVAVNAGNDAPVISTPPAQVTAQDTPLIFGTGRGNEITVADADAGSAGVSVSLGATHGTVTLAGEGLTFTSGANGTPALSLVAAAGDVDSLLNDLRFDPEPGYSGGASLTLSVDDQGNTGAGGAKTDTDTIGIAVSPPGAIDFVPAAYSIGEDGASVTLTVNRTGGAAGPATIDYAVSGGTATAGADFTAATGTLTFADGETSQTFAVAVADDALDEDDETVNVALGNPGGSGVLGVFATTAVITIADNDPPPTLSVGDASATEGGVATFTVTLSAASGRPVTVDFAAAGGTATAGSDFAAAAGTLTFAPGETGKTIAVATLGDDVTQEQPEAFTVTLANAANATVADGVGDGTINNLPNETPVPATDVVTLAPGQASAIIAVLANDTDADGDPVRLESVTAPVHGTAVRNADDTITYTPAFGYSGADSFTYAVADGRGGVANGTVNVTVAGNGVVANPTDPRKQDLFFAATPGDDRVLLARAGRQVRVLLNGQDQGAFAATGTLVISGGGGNDTLAVGRLRNPVLFHGGDGADTLTGGARGDVLVGGPGNDSLNAGGGPDVIIGGDGADTVLGLGGNDLLIAGTTAYDADTADNRRALGDLLAALAARGRYAAKLAALTSTAGVGLSGARLAPGTTLFDDADVDTLVGGGSQDFFAAADTDGLAVDVLTKRAKNESVIEL